MGTTENNQARRREKDDNKEKAMKTELIYNIIISIAVWGILALLLYKLLIDLKILPPKFFPALENHEPLPQKTPIVKLTVFALVWQLCVFCAAAIIMSAVQGEAVNLKSIFQKFYISDVSSYVDMARDWPSIYNYQAPGGE